MYSTYYYWSKILQKKKRINKNALLKPKKEFEARDDKKYEIKAIINSMIYDKEVTDNKMPKLYYLILWKSYLKEKST